ncbi:DUF4231 domain-containing protein [Micromonospora endophytica]|uniref:DUF4231 domain-containing protein n=2 Tax=Micromonospora endophytica TaxID=515350 RepID=A0A2W2DHP3_9ACTN|nr:DUF4231 domain-containing protein [Micromonospora endophytica]
MAAYRRLAETNVSSLRKQYDWRAKWHRRHFRFTGILVIVVSAALPLLAGFRYPGKDVVIALAGVVIATATALRTFYQWDQMWSLLRRTHFELIRAFSQWELEFGRAESVDDPQRREELGYEATRALLEKVETIRSGESEKFFGALSFPEGGVGGRMLRVPPQPGG